MSMMFSEIARVEPLPDWAETIGPDDFDALKPEPDAARLTPAARRSVEAHRREIMRETGAASVSVIVTY